MEKTPFQTRCNIKMAALGMTQTELGERIGQSQARIAKAMSGAKDPSYASLRVTIDQALTRLVGEKRKRMAEEIKKAAERQIPILEGELSVLLPEDVMYIVLQDGEPIALWFPETKTIKALPPTLGM